MESGRALPIIILLALSLALTGCITTVVRPAGAVIGTEDAAVEKLGNDILSIKIILNDKKIGIYNFTTLDWQVIDAGRRISSKLSNYLMRKGGLRIVPEAELAAKLKTQTIEQARLLDPDAARRKTAGLPVDVTVIGLLVQDMGTVKIELKAVDVATGRLILLSGARIPSTGELGAQEKPELTALYKKSPEKIIEINKAFYLLQWIKERQPLVFLLVAVKDSEMKNLRKTNAVLTGKMAVRKARYERERPDVMRKIGNLREGLSLMERYDRQRFGEIMKLKKELLSRMK